MSRRIVPINNNYSDDYRQNSANNLKSKYKQEVGRRKRGLPQQEILEEEAQMSMSSQPRKRPNQRARQKREQKKTNRSSDEEDDSEEDSKKSSSSDESEESDREQKRKIAKQMKMKQMQVIKSKKLIGEKEAVIGTLSTQINQQSQNLQVLNKENESLRAKTDQLKSVVAEKQVVQSQFAAQGERVANAKKAFMRRESMRIDFKADILSQAFKKDSTNFQAFGNSISGFFERQLLSFDKHYFLSSKVYQISNTYGSKCEAFFHKNASLINCYLCAIIIFLPFFIMFFLSDVSISGINSLFVYSYPSSLGNVFAISVAVFLAIQILIAFRKYQVVKKKEVSEDAKEGRGIQSFKIIFSRWNWRNCENTLITKSQYALARHARDYFQFFDRLDEKYDYKNPSLWQILGIKLLTLSILSGTVIVPAFLHFKGILLELTTMTFVSEIIHGLVIAVIGEIAAKTIIFFNQYEEVVDLYKINSNKYKKKFIGKALPCAISILLAYSTFLNNGTLNLDFLDTQITFKSSKFKFRAEQTSHCLVGLLIGQFLMNVISQLIPSLLRFFKKRQEDESSLFKQIEFNMMESAVPLITQNMIILTLIPFSPFAIFLAIFIFSLDFIYEWVILAKLRLPQYQGLPKAYLRTHFCSFFNQSLVFVFCIYALFFTKNYLPGIGESNPFNYAGNSLYGSLKDHIRQYQVPRVIYDSVTWFPLIACLMVVYYVASMSSDSIKDSWRKEINNKITNINGIKVYYEARIKRLEDRIEQAKGELGGGMPAESKSTASKKSEDDDPLFIRNDEPILQKPSIQTIDNELSYNPTGSYSNRLKVSSYTNSQNNIYPGSGSAQQFSSSKFAPATQRNIQQQENNYVSRTRINTKDDYNLL